MGKCLRSISQLLAGSRDLLREHAQVVREAEHILENIDCADQILGVVDTCTSESFDEPECAHAESSFAATNTWRRWLVLTKESRVK
jgi:hypothetical protein